jgi:hypothetical protein
MEGSVTRASLIAIAACLAAVACEDDPARSVRIIPRPPPTAAALAEAPRSGPPPRIADWRPDACPPPAEPGTGGGRAPLVVSGPCAFEHRAGVSCESTGDDFIIAITRPAAHGGTVVIYINVETYHGPGAYEGAQMFLEVEDGTSIYRWSNDNFPMTVGADEKFVVLPTTRLEGEPLLVNCSGKVGPQSNWLYDCAGSRLATAIENTSEVVSGTLWCAGANAPQ